MPIGNNILAGASGQATGYDIDQSLRFEDGDSAKLDRTPSGAGNRKTWTWSCWVKHSTVASDYWENLFGAYTDANNYAYIVFEDDVLRFFDYQSGSAVASTSTSEPKYRDPSAWRHIVVTLDTTQATDTNRLKFYINGEQLTLPASVTYPSQNDDGLINSAINHRIGGDINGEFDGYLAEMHFIDGTALDASSFGETNSDTNQWVPIKYAGSYGTNGFYLKFQDSSALGDDSSGNTNDFSATNLVATDQVLDSPTNNFATLNPLWRNHSGGTSTFSEGDLKQYNQYGDVYWPSTQELPTTGKWYFECYGDTGTGMYGIRMQDNAGSTNPTIANGDKAYLWTSSGIEYPKNTVVNSTTYASGDILGFAVNLDDGEIKFYKNNSLAYTGTNMNTLGYDYLLPVFWHTDGSTVWVNFGQDSSFAGTKSGSASAQDANGKGDFFYTPVSNHLALCTDNLPDPSIADPTKHFDTTLYTGTGATKSISSLAFAPDFTWIKSRDNAYLHNLQDTIRGAGESLFSNNTDEETTDADSITSFDSNGWTMGADDSSWTVNKSGPTYVGWAWKAGGTASSNTDGTITSSVSANTDAGFSIATYTGNESAATVGHGLSSAPELVMVKRRDTAANWIVGSDELQTSYWDYYIILNTDAAEASESSNFGYNTNPTATTFPLGNNAATNASGGTYVAYCFHSVDGYSKVGSYTGNGNADGTFIYTGFRPAWVLVKRSNAVHNWYMFDNKRDVYNAVDANLQANDSAAEDDGPIDIDFVSNGIKLRDSGNATNNSGGSYIYLAFAESPFKTANAR